MTLMDTLERLERPVEIGLGVVSAGGTLLSGVEFFHANSHNAVGWLTLSTLGLMASMYLLIGNKRFTEAADTVDVGSLFGPRNRR